MFALPAIVANVVGGIPLQTHKRKITNENCIQIGLTVERQTNKFVRFRLSQCQMKIKVQKITPSLLLIRQYTVQQQQHLFYMFV